MINPKNQIILTEFKKLLDSSGEFLRAVDIKANIDALIDEYTETKSRELLGLCQEFKAHLEGTQTDNRNEKSNLTSKLYGSPVLNNSFELSARLKEILEHGVKQFESILEERTIRLTKAGVGTFWNKEHEWNRPNYQFKTKIRSTKKETVLADEYLDMLYGEIKAYLAGHMEMDEQLALDSISKIHQELNLELKQNGIKSVIYSCKGQDQVSQKRELLLDGLPRFDEFSRYEQKKKLYEYFFEVRRSGFLLTMALSAVGANQWSGFREYGYWVFIVSTVLLTWGILDAIAKHRDQKEDFEEELAKDTRKHLTSEFKKLLMEFQADWKASLPPWYKMNISELGKICDRDVKIFYKKYEEKQKMEKMEVQARITWLDKNLLEIPIKVKTTENVINILQQLPA